MKKTVILLMVLWLAPLFALAAEQQVLRINVKGMTCDICVAKVQSSLSKLSGVEKVSVDLEMGWADVLMAAGKKADVEGMKKAILDAGYTPGNISISTK